MNRTYTALLLPLVPFTLSGCFLLGIGQDDDYRDAPPVASQVQIPVPTAGGKTSAQSLDPEAGAATYALLGETSELYKITYDISWYVNTHAASLLGLVKLVTAFPPTSQTSNSRTWGPYMPGGLEPLTYRMTVTKLRDKQFRYSIDGRPKASRSDADFLPLLSGEITRTGEPLRAKGVMTLHFDNRRVLLPESCEQGTIDADFDTTAWPARLDVVFTRVGSTNPKGTLCRGEPPRDAIYHYDEAADRSGNFVFELASNIHGAAQGKPALESLLMRSRWLADGRGRSDVKVSAGEVATDLMSGGFKEGFVAGSQCWDDGFKTVFQTATPGALGVLPTQGKEGDCVYTSAQLPELMGR